MAISWGSWASGQSGSRSRLGVDRSTSTTASQITVTIVVYLEFSGYYMNSNATLTASGGHSGTRAVSLNFSSSGTRNLGTFTQTFTRPWGSQTSERTQFSISGSAGGNPTIGEGYYLPRRLYLTPASPSSVTASFTRDGVAGLSWSIAGSTSAPVTSVEVTRQSNNNSWGTNASTFTSRSGSTSFSNLSRGNRYRWRVRGKNQDATGAWGTSGWVYMRPEDVANVSAARSGSDIRVTWVNRDSIDYAGYRVYDNGTLIGTVSAGTTSYTHSSPDPAVPHRYSVRAYYGSLEAAHVYSNTVQLLAAPLAPTNLSPDGGYVLAGSTASISWSHNAVDGSSQTAREVQARKVGNTSWTTYSGTTAESGTLPISTLAAHGDDVEWRVRTKGDHASWSPWSDVSSFGVASRPTVSFTSPAAGAAIATSSVLVTMTFSRAPISYSLELRRGSTVLRTVNGYSPTTTHSVTMPGLRNGESYSLRVVATDLVDSTATSRSFTAAFPQPEPPSLEGSWDVRLGAVSVTVTPPASSTPPASRVRLERADGTLVGEESATRAITIVDRHAPVNGAAEYVAYSIAQIGEDAIESAPSEVLNVGAIPEAADFLNFGDQVVRVRHVPGLSRGTENADVHLIDLDDGTPDPVAIFGINERHTTGLSGLLLDADGDSAADQARRFRELGTWKDLVLLRPIDADPVWGIVTGMTQPRELWGGYQVTLTHTRAR